MKITTDEAINLIADDSINQYNRAFTQEAVRVWDKEGQGSFALYVLQYVAKRWSHMISSN